MGPCGPTAGLESVKVTEIWHPGEARAMQVIGHIIPLPPHSDNHTEVVIILC